MSPRDLAAVALVCLSALGCSGTGKDRCDPSTCQGCCDSTGQCQLGTSTSACGAQGAQCAACAASDVCTGGTCATGDGGTATDAGGGTAPQAGELAATCTTTAECNDVPGGGGVCPPQGFPSEQLGCGKACSSDTDCGSGNWCVDFTDAGFTFLGKLCVRGCSVNGDCNAGYQQQCVCDLVGPTKRWCSPWPGSC
ncbi:MAG: hypothetical protein ACOZIN_11260 [Myxococcota bacterium]